VTSGLIRDMGGSRFSAFAAPRNKTLIPSPQA
jgi:hypothetical protein